MVDTRPRVDLGLLRAGIGGARQLDVDQRELIERADRERADELLVEAAELLARHELIDGGGLVRTGEPGTRICAAAAAAQADVIGLRARQRGPPTGLNPCRAATSWTTRRARSCCCAKQPACAAIRRHGRDIRRESVPAAGPPARVPDWAAAMGGGLAMIVVGALSPAGAVEQLLAAWNIFLFFLGLSISAAVADRAGLFRAAAVAAANMAGHSQRRLLIGLFVVGAAVTAILSNDATALLLTPVAFAVASRLGLNPRPYAFTCALVANAASFVLPVSNPANLLLLARAPLSLAGFVGQLALPSLAALLTTLGGLLVIFRQELALPISRPRHGPPASTDGRRRIWPAWRA